MDLDVIGHEGANESNLDQEKIDPVPTWTFDSKDLRYPLRRGPGRGSMQCPTMLWGTRGCAMQHFRPSLAFAWRA
jgi:hypothetical protein